MKKLADVLEGVSIDPDIEKLLEEAKSNSDLNAARATKEYHLGCLEERARIFGEGFFEIKERVAGYAETFLRALRGVFPADAILQYRIGKDYTAGTPVVFTVISEKYEDKKEAFFQMASAFELYLYNDCRCDCDFWIVSERGLEQSLVERDFPYYRENINALV